MRLWEKYRIRSIQPAKENNTTPASEFNLNQIRTLEWKCGANPFDFFNCNGD